MYDTYVCTEVLSSGMECKIEKGGIVSNPFELFAKITYLHIGTYVHMYCTYIHTYILTYMCMDE
jgi:hypothetical protein